MTPSLAFIRGLPSYDLQALKVGASMSVFRAIINLTKLRFIINALLPVVNRGHWASADDMRSQVLIESGKEGEGTREKG
jgi:hypothetical protein